MPGERHNQLADRAVRWVRSRSSSMREPFGTFCGASLVYEPTRRRERGVCVVTLGAFGVSSRRTVLFGGQG